MNAQKIWNNYLNVLKKYTAFEGRAGREEFWLFVLVNFIIYFVLSFIGPLGYLYSLAVLIPSLAVGARRLHDIGRSGWFLLLGLIPLVGPIVLIVLAVQVSQDGTNEYEAPPVATLPDCRNNLKRKECRIKSTAFDFTTCFNLVWEIYKKHFLLLVGASLVAAILIFVSFGILTGPILAGLLTLMLKLMDNDSSAKFEDIFGQFDTFATTFLIALTCYLSLTVFIGTLVLCASILSTIGMLFLGSLSPIFTLILIPIFIAAELIALFGVLFIILPFSILSASQRKLDFAQAVKNALIILKTNLWPLIGFAALASILGSIGSVAFGIGAIFTMPMLYLMLAAAYRACLAQAPGIPTAGGYIDVE